MRKRSKRFYYPRGIATVKRKSLKVMRGLRKSSKFHSSPSSSSKFPKNAENSFSRVSKKFLQDHKEELSLYHRLFVGESKRAKQYFLSRWLFLRLLGIIYLFAIGSYWFQYQGLIGSNGILPTDQYLPAVWNKLGITGYWTFPTLFWINCSDAFIHLLICLGILLSIFLVLGIIQIPSLIGLWLIYLSITRVSQVFLGYQWDALLLETGFLAIFLAPCSWKSGIYKDRAPSKIVIWLFFWLIFRLMFSSGIVKLNSGDLSWNTLTALHFHYETQPLPNLVAWYTHQLPKWFQKLSVAGTLIIEILIPFLVFTPRRSRIFAWGAFTLLQVLIFLTGNYCYFNLLTLVLCVLLLDDAFLALFFPRKWILALSNNNPRCTSLTSLILSIVIAAFLVPIGIIQMKSRVFGLQVSDMEKSLVSWTRPFGVVNSYGLFANMTESRPEIIVEGSNDQREWQAYEFKWKPGKLNKPPEQVAPHQPRIDWQMWFEALNYQGGNHPTFWFKAFLTRILEGKKEVLNLLEHNPFPNEPPKYIRAVVYDYKFTNFMERKQNGNWWKRNRLGLYVPPSGLMKN